jgi:uncharacterized membrane protein required for colicin V production
VSLALAVDWVDFGTVGLLVVFMVWGSLHGALRQALGLVALLAAFALASPLGPRIETSVAKVVTLSPSGTACAAWATVWFATLVAAGIVLHLMHGPLQRARLAGPWDRAVGAVFGFLKGVAVLALALYALLGWWGAEPGPRLAQSIRESTTAKALRGLEVRLRPTLQLPPPVQDRVELVNAWIEKSGSP